jgi:hypothetical protein
MKKFSKLILEKKKERWTKHPLVNAEDWNQIFNPLIEHILTNRTDDPMTGNGIFSSETKAALDELIDKITEDYVQYYQDMVDDGSQESFFDAYSLKIDYSDMKDCLLPFTDRTEDIEDYPSWDGGYYYESYIRLKYQNTDELIQDVIDVYHKLKIYKTNFKIKILTNLGASTMSAVIYDNTPEEKISIAIQNVLELPSQRREQWISGLRGIEVFLFNKETVQAVDLTDF